MLIKFEPQSVRVKGLAFHPKRKWILASLHSGVIKLWDYGEKVLIDQYDEHKGPVRGLDFHRHQPLFVSGGDDAKIKVWNYKTKKCLFTLDAHEDYIRTTCFHHEHPWILSASDDQSIRIWNWQSRSRVTILTGHTHYVMCAQFHPSMELILSASIDQTLRLWDITGLKTKATSSSPSSKEESNVGFPELLTKTDYSVESKEAHNSEINWCSFHPDPSKQLCLSAADDSHVKVWRVDARNGLREIDTLRGHYNNVNCAIFHPKKDLIITASEDKSVKVWDLEKRTALGTHRREYDRFWTLAAHPSENLFAAGHDSGFTLFKLERERPAFTVCKDIMLFIKGKQLCMFDMKTGDKRVLVYLKPKTEMTHYYHTIHCHSYEENRTNEVLISVRSNTVDKGVCDLYKISSGALGESCEPIRSQGLTGLFIGPRRYAVLDRHNKVIFKMDNEERKSKFTITANEIFPAGSGRLLVKTDAGQGQDNISLWDIEKGCDVCSLKVEARRVVISDNRNYIACLGKRKITICDGNLRVLSTIQEQRRIKSAAWGESGVLIYTTPVHIKYALSDGHTTTIISVSQTLYIVAVRDDKVFCIDRNSGLKEIPVDSREFKFKQAVIRNDRGAILSSLRQLGSLTRAEISFLVKKGHPGLALKFVKDDQTRFPLALQAYAIDDALEAAIKINDKRCWTKLAEAAMEIGHVRAAERAYIELKKPYKLAMLYLCCGQKGKMLEARSLAKSLGDTSTELIISVLIKDFVECVHIMRRSGHVNLAYVCAVNHGLYDLAEELRDDLTDEQLNLLPALSAARKNSSWSENSILDIPDDVPFQNWPLLNDETENIEAVLASEEPEEIVEAEDDGDWGDDESKSSVEKQDDDMDELEDAQENGWSDDEPLEDLMDDDENGQPAPVADKVSLFSAPNPGQSITSRWSQKSDLALHHVLAGSYKSALILLQNQVGAVNFEHLKDIIKDLAFQSRAAYKGLALYPTMYAFPSTNSDDSDSTIPAAGYDIEDLEKKDLIKCYSLFSSGKFSDAIVGFRNLLACVLFIQTQSSDHELEEIVSKAKKLMTISREYILALQIWLERKNITGKEFEDQKRVCELAAYFAKLNLTRHRVKVLEKALDIYRKAPEELKKTRAAASIARRLLDHVSTSDPDKKKIAEAAERIKQSYDAQIDQKIQLDYDDLNPYSLCAATFRPIYSGNQLTECPLCDAKYNLEFNGSLCRVCEISKIGKKCPGIKFQASEYL